MSSRGGGSKVYSLAMFIVVSVVCGLFVAGMGIPFAALTTGTLKTASDNLQNIPTDLTVPQQPQASKILLSDGSVLATFFDQNRQYVDLDQISPLMQKAQLAIEDHRFFINGAIDFQGILRAALGNVATGGVSAGGSTLTQQYIKQVRIQIAEDNNDKEAIAEAQSQTIGRKILEMRYAVALEKTLTAKLGSTQAAKNAILERYLNIAYYGDGAYGVQAAARHYFSVDAKDLNLAQSAMLAGLVQSPSETDPVNHPDAAVARRNVVLDTMLKWDNEGVWFHGAPQLTQQEVDAAKATGFDASKVSTNNPGCTASKYPFICQYAENVLLSDQMSSLGSDQDARKRALNRGGLIIRTDIDPLTQDAAQNAIASIIAPTDPVVSVAVMTDPKTGLIKAMAQSKPVMGSNAAAGETYYNYAVGTDMGGAAGFQAGSTFKAFVAAAAIDQGFIPDRTIYNAAATRNWDGQVFKDCTGSFQLDTNGQGWTVSNSWKYGQMNMLVAMAQSVNNYWVQLEQDVGICSAIKMAEAAGMRLGSGGSLEDYQRIPSFTLGALDVTPLSMAEAYATFANRGVRCDPIILASVTNPDGTTLAVPQANCQQVIDPVTADGVNYTLQQVLKPGGTGYASRVQGSYDQAGKTGTAGSTETESAVWFNAYTPDLEGVAMISVDTGNNYWNGRPQTLTGLTVASGRTLHGNSTTESGGIWNSMMSAELPRIPNSGNSRFTAYAPKNSTMPSNYSGLRTSPGSGSAPSSGNTVAPASSSTASARAAVRPDDRATAGTAVAAIDAQPATTPSAGSASTSRPGRDAAIGG
ncbi:transglycosylase domain-containing protein [Propionibacterium cyclohexanicum]|nr:transglycosylase domain-containing protein [Propionibacterium cyclohexanicum]